MVHRHQRIHRLVRSDTRRHTHPVHSLTRGLFHSSPSASTDMESDRPVRRGQHCHPHGHCDARASWTGSPDTTDRNLAS